MMAKKFTEMSDTELWEDFKDTEYKGTAMNRLLREFVNGKPHWCCEYIKQKERPCITFKDGTKMRIHYCPRCGRAL